MARTGLRVSELVELNKTHINVKLDNKGLFVIYLNMMALIGYIIAIILSVIGIKKFLLK